MQVEAKETVLTLIVQELDECPSNDQCANAERVDGLPYTTTSTNAFARPLGSEEADYGIYSCDRLPTSERASWYEITGSGSCLGAYVWSSGEAILGVYSGSSCQNITCAAQSSQYDDRNVLWLGEEGETYYVVVGGYSWERPGLLDFSMYINEATDCPTVPANDLCTNATAIDSFPFTYSGSLELASMTNSSETGGCFYEDARTVWFEVATKENNTCYQADLQLDDFEYGWLSVHEDNCTSLQCLSQGEGAPASVTWTADAGEKILLAVSQPAWRPGPGSRYALTVKVCIRPFHRCDAPLSNNAGTGVSLCRKQRLRFGDDCRRGTVQRLQ